LVVGGLGGGVIPIDSVEIWDGTSASFSPIAPLPLPRGGHTATPLRDGRVLIVGNDGTGPDFADPASAELWDPATGTFTPTGSMAVARRGHTATLLPDGRVLVIGGIDPTSPDGRPIALAEAWDPATGAFTAAGTLAAGRTEHSATLLPDGRILVAGGGECSRTAEIWDPATAAFTPTGSMAASRAAHTATLLPDGRVLALGGWGDDDRVATAELWDPASGTFTATGSMQTARFGHTATRLANGSVLVVGGAVEEDGVRGLVAEVWDPATSSFRTAGTLASGRHFHTATLLRDGRVLIVGHGARNDPLATSEFWDPSGLDGPRISPSPTPSGPSPTEAPRPAASGELPAASAGPSCP
ncbi:MAG TPA: kelch repeat-containing protein, partial [Candidatus Limnocylindrales bacterium]|nr:kelch repeat-containing protein [Candidatus Limnocylindrales bacterium]